MESNTYFHAYFIAGALILYAPSLWLKTNSSDRHYSQTKRCMALTYNIALCMAHLNFVQNGEIFFVGVFDNTVMGWLSMGMSVLHAASTPFLPGKRSRPKRRGFDPRL